MEQWQKLCDDIQVAIDTPFTAVVKLAETEGYTSGQVAVAYEEYVNSWSDPSKTIATFTVSADLKTIRRDS